MRVWLVLLIVLLPAVTAFSISPATQFAIAPEGELANITIVNTDTRNTTLAIEIDASIQPFLEAPIESFSLQPGQVAIYRYSIDVPANTLPGVYEGNIIIEETQERFARGVQALLAIAQKVTVVVPEEGKHLDAHIVTSPPITGEPLAITLLLNNLGTESLEAVEATIRMGDAKWQTYATAVPYGERGRLEVTWDRAEQGDYDIVADITFDGQTLRKEKAIRVGTILIEASELGFSSYTPGEPLRVSQELHNKWTEETSVTVYHTINTTPPMRFRSPPTVLVPGQPINATLFWETDKLGLGTYKLDTRVENSATQTDRSYIIYVTEDGIFLEEETELNIWLIVSVALIILIAALFIAGWKRV